ncbi:MAG: hypothetical protein N3G79_00680 [Sulfolobales archaeon]|nr:hypothetical protein [Sulfolobales archaeon]
MELRLLAVLKLKVLPGYFLYVAKSGRGISNLVKTIYKCGESSKAIFIVKPSIVPVWLRSERPVYVSIPPSSVVVDPSILETCEVEKFDYKVAGEVRVDGKPFPLVRDLARRGVDCLLADALEEVFGNLSRNGRCYVVCECKAREIIKILLNPMVSDLSTIKDVDKVRVEGLVSTLWSAHPVLYGVKLGGKIGLEIANVDGTPLKHYVKTLAFLDRYALLYEVPYSSSILFTGFSEDLSEVATRAVLYTC